MSMVFGLIMNKYREKTKGLECHRGHPIVLCYPDEDDEEQVECDICKTCIDEDTAYCCDSCYSYFHKSCAELPFKISHPFHKKMPREDKPLRLVINKNPDTTWCDSCHQIINDPIYYRCNASCMFCPYPFRMHVKCALMKPIAISKRHPQIQHHSHQHPMVLIDGDHDADVCFACQSLCRGPAYACDKCKYFLHKSCAEVPQLIDNHPHHRRFPIYGRLSHEDKCDKCLKSHRIIFRCFSVLESHCSFRRCIKCCIIYTPPTIKYRGHKHQLSLYEDAVVESGAEPCNASYSYCHQGLVLDELKRTQRYALYCCKCKFMLHLLCGPLPCTIKASSHIHPLHLVDSLYNEDEDSDKEYYCDLCESERDPAICVYLCSDCNYVSHVHCAISEVVQVLKSSSKDVNLRTIRKSDSAIEAEQEHKQASLTEEKKEDKTLFFKFNGMIKFQWISSFLDFFKGLLRAERV